jgi:ABC-type Zn uptake system ZnuABC Zn-binding protein ZnuA
LARGRTRTSTNQPTPADAKILSRARLVVVNGLGFGGWIDRLIKSSGYRGKLVVANQSVNAIRQPQANPANSYLGMTRQDAKALADWACWVAARISGRNWRGSPIGESGGGIAAINDR